MAMRGDLRALEAGAAKQRRNRVTEVARRVVAAHQPPGQKAVGRRHITADVDEVEAATGPQYAKDLPRRRGLGLTVQVVPHHRGQHTVERVVLERQLLNVTTYEADLVTAADLSLRPGQRAQIRIDADDRGTRVCPMHACSEIASTAADFENRHAVGDDGLGDERLVDLGHTQDAGEQVVERKECVPAGGGQVVVVTVPSRPRYRIWMIFGHSSMVKRVIRSKLGDHRED